jgi:predicted CDP-diglyceride synthetase/phosphatidate cytidylyltransferase
MNIEVALQSDVFLTYLKIIGGLLAFAGVMIGVLRAAGKNVAGVWNTYRGWLVMVPIVIGAIFLGRAATIAGVGLLAMFGFKEFARATGFLCHRPAARL